MISGVHIVLFSRQAERVRDFLGKVLELQLVDAGEGWPIFAAPPTEIAVHPTEEEGEEEIYLMCDDVNATVAALSARGIETDGTISDRGWGLLTTIVLPGGDRLGLYEPRHPSPIRDSGVSSKKSTQ
jgi:hypothetical protein